MPETWREHVNFLELTTTYLTQAHVAEGGDTVEAISRIEHVAARLNAIAKSLRSEIPERADWQGGGYRTMHRSLGNQYSFNTDAILRDIARALHDRYEGGLGFTPGDALRVAVEEGAVTLGWKITGLEKLFAKLDRALTIEPREVADDVESPAHVGRVSKGSKVDIVPVEVTE